MKVDFGITKNINKILIVSDNDNISFSYFANVKHTWNSMQIVSLNYRFQNSFTIRLDVLCLHRESTDTHQRHNQVLVRFDQK